MWTYRWCLNRLIFFTVLAGALQTTPLAAQIVNIEEARITGTNDSTHWYGHIKGAVNLVKVAQKSLQINSEVRVQYKNDPHMALFLFNGALLRAGDQDFTKQAFAHVRYNYKLSGRWTTEVFLQIQSNPLQLLKTRSLAGAGLRFRALKSADGRQRLYLGAATLLEENVFADPYGRETRHRLSTYASVTLRAGKQTVLYGTTYWQPVWGYAPLYRMSTDWSLQVAISKHLSFTAEFTYNLDTNLPETAPATTYLWRNGLIWHF